MVILVYQKRKTSSAATTFSVREQAKVTNLIFQFLQPGHYDRSRCSQYGTKVKLRWAKLIARRLVAKLRGQEFDSDDDSSESDEGRNKALETLGEIVHKVDDWGKEAKVAIKDGFEDFKEQSTSFFKKIGSGFEKLKIKKNNNNNNNNAPNNNNNSDKKSDVK